MKQRIGVGGRLLFAFISISGFAVLAAAAALYSFAQLGSVLARITEKDVPSALAFLDLSLQSQRLVTAAPPLLAVTDQRQYEVVSSEVQKEGSRLAGMLADLDNFALGADELDQIEALVAELLDNLEELNELVADQLRLGDEKELLLRQLSRTNIGVQRMLAPGILVMDAKISQWQRMFEAEDTALVTQKQARGMARTIAPYIPIRKAQEQAAIINNTLLQAAASRTEPELRLLMLPLNRAFGRLEELSADFAAELQPRSRDVLAQLEQLIEGPTSISAIRKLEIQGIERGEALLQQNGVLSARLTTSVDHLVNRAGLNIKNANAQALAVQQISTLILLLVVLLSLFSSLAIVWFYVRRNLVARLLALNDSMLAIAGGELNRPIPPTGGGDEISAMAEALHVFRDTAVEVRQSNLREITEARRRLSEAIESISEGFSLYDTDDRLIASNSRYQEVLYPDIADIVRPGVLFEEVVRTAVQRQLIGDAQDDPEAWVRRRMELHRNPTGPHLQRQSDGRWIQIDERKLYDGGTVAIYTDITELKEREKELADKSNALEQLSNQLAKYLSPQVYESIFSGRQEVKVSSRRKKLSIFFSDITDFTQAADRLESEELSSLLNHYLTEMSRIALSFGATVDKYVGDAMLIFFGDPETRGVKQDALACVQMALAMRNRMHDLAHIWRASGIDRPLRVRMGVNTGYCTVGNFGSEDRMDYTIIGGAVNIASRLQAAATPGEILISYETFAHVRDQIKCIEMGEISVKGVAYPVATFQVVDAYQSLKSEKKHFIQRQPNLNIDLNIQAMTEDERGEAAALLRRGLRLIEEKDE